MEINKFLKKHIKKWSKHYEVLVGALVGALALIITIFVVVIPVYRAHIDLQLEKATLEKKIEALDQFAVKYRDYENYYIERNREMAYLRQVLPATLEGKDNIGELQQLAKKNGLRLNCSALPRQYAKKSRLENSIIEFKAVGSYTNMLRFLAGIENLGNASVVEPRIEVNNVGDLQLQGKYYVYAFADK